MTHQHQNNKSLMITHGPLPLAQQFEQYEKILPGAAERILKQAEKEQDNRFINDARAHESNTAIINNNHIQKMAGIIAGGIFCIAIVSAGACLVFAGHDVAGTSMVGATLGGVATAFVTGRKYNK